MTLIIDAIRRSHARAWCDLVPSVVEMFRDGGDLSPIEFGWLTDWLAARGRNDLEPEDVQTVQIPRDWAAKVLGGHQQSATRALQTLQMTEILTLIHKGIKGHASLYCVNPLPEPKGDTLTYPEGKCEMKYPHTLEEYPHTLGEIPSHQDSVNWGDTT